MKMLTTWNAPNRALVVSSLPSIPKWTVLQLTRSATHSRADGLVEILVRAERTLVLFSNG
jgi:hypothetical protein